MRGKLCPHIVIGSLGLLIQLSLLMTKMREKKSATIVVVTVPASIVLLTKAEDRPINKMEEGKASSKDVGQNEN